MFNGQGIVFIQSYGNTLETLVVCCCKTCTGQWLSSHITASSKDKRSEDWCSGVIQFMQNHEYSSNNSHSHKLNLANINKCICLESCFFWGFFCLFCLVFLVFFSLFMSLMKNWKEKSECSFAIQNEDIQSVIPDWILTEHSETIWSLIANAKRKQAALCYGTRLYVV